jgi:glycosyltransferase involved in cell wall biosynthesis
MPETHSTAARKRRLALCMEYPIQQHGGTEVLVRELIHGFAPTYDVVLVSNDEPSILNAPEFHGKIQQHFRWKPGGSSAAAKQLAAQLHKAEVDLAHFHFGGTFGWNARRPSHCPIVHLEKFGVPCLSTNHGVFWLLDGYIGPQKPLAVKLALLPFAWLARLRVLKSLKAEVAVSRADFETLQRRFWPARGKFRQIYHSRLHEADYVPGTRREKVVLCSGSIGRRKAQPVLARAFQQLSVEFPEWKLVFVGRIAEPDVAEELKSVIASAPSQITWLQNCSDEELTEWYRRAEVFALPSIHEGLGLALQEALFHECACVASRVGGICDLIQDGINGLLAPPNNAAALRDALARLLRDRTLCERLRAAGRQSVLDKGMTVERMLANYSQLYDGVINHGL